MAKLYSMAIPHSRVQIDCSDSVEPSMTRPEFADECDINKLMARYEKAGQWPPAPMREPMYFDADQVPSSFHDMMNFMLDAETAFMSIPANARFALDNDPARFVEFASNPENLEKMREWGLAPPAPAKPAPQEVRIVDAPPVPPAPSGAPKSS